MSKQTNPADTSAHTATPWKVRYHPNGRDCFIEGPRPDGMPYAVEIMGDDYNGFGGAEARKADAEFIVRACNRDHAFDDLVAALEESLDHIFDGTSPDIVARLEQVLNRAKAAK